jgi:hypothetical protein
VPVTVRIPPASRSFDIRGFVQAGESLVTDGSGPGNNTAIFQRAIDALTALGYPATIYAPNGRYVLAQAGVNNAVPYALQWKTRVGLRGESEAGTVFLSDAGSTPLFGAYGPQLVDCSFTDFTVDAAAQTNGSYTTQLKGMFMQDLLRPRWAHVTIRNAWATGLGCDYLVDAQLNQVTTIGNGRGIAATGSDPLAVSGGSGVGIGTGKYQSEPMVITGLISRGNGRGGLFFEKQTTATFYARGIKVIGAVLVGNGFGLQDCGCDGLDADITATDNTIAGVLLDGTLLNANAGYNGRISGRIDRNGSTAIAVSGNVVLGAMPAGNYRIGSAGATAASSPMYGVISRTTAVLGPRIVLDLAADKNGAAGVYIQPNGATVRALTISGSARDNGQDNTQTRREGVVVAVDTDLLDVSAVCIDDQTSPTQTYGLYTKGAVNLTRGVESAHPGGRRHRLRDPVPHEQRRGVDDVHARPVHQHTRHCHGPDQRHQVRLPGRQGHRRGHRLLHRRARLGRPDRPAAVLRHVLPSQHHHGAGLHRRRRGRRAGVDRFGRNHLEDPDELRPYRHGRDGDRPVCCLAGDQRHQRHRLRHHRRHQRLKLLADGGPGLPLHRRRQLHGAVLPGQRELEPA